VAPCGHLPFLLGAPRKNGLSWKSPPSRSSKAFLERNKEVEQQQKIVYSFDNNELNLLFSYELEFAMKNLEFLGMITDAGGGKLGR
jgi:hypothetical protein